MGGAQRLMANFFCMEAALIEVPVSQILLQGGSSEIFLNKLASRCSTSCSRRTGTLILTRRSSCSRKKEAEKLAAPPQSRSRNRNEIIGAAAFAFAGYERN